MKKIREKIGVSLAYRLTPIIGGHESAVASPLIIIEFEAMQCQCREVQGSAVSQSQSLILINQARAVTR